MGRKEEAYKAYEELLLSGYQMANIVFYSLYSLAMQEKDIEKAGKLVEKQSQLAAVFEMGEYNAISSRLDLAVAEKDVDLVLKIAEKMLSSVYKMGEWTDSFLYEHLSFKTIDENFIPQMRDNLLQLFRNDEEYAFLKDDKRWQELVN